MLCCETECLIPDWHSESCTATPVYAQLSKDLRLADTTNDLHMVLWRYQKSATYYVFDDGQCWSLSTLTNKFGW